MLPLDLNFVSAYSCVSDYGCGNDGFDDECSCYNGYSDLNCDGNCPQEYECREKVRCCGGLFEIPGDGSNPRLFGDWVFLYDCFEQECGREEEIIPNGGCCSGLRRSNGHCCHQRDIYDSSVGYCHEECQSGEVWDDGRCKNLADCAMEGDRPVDHDSNECCQGLVDCNGICRTQCCVSDQGRQCGTCGRGTIQCGGSCSGDYSNCGSTGWQNVGSCGKCGTYQRYCDGCDWKDTRCAPGGPCNPGEQKSCTYGTVTCQSNCQWPDCPSCAPDQGAACGACGRGRKNCDGSCTNPSDYSTCSGVPVGWTGWINSGSCPMCGTQQYWCNGCDITTAGNCDRPSWAVCNPGDTQSRSCPDGSTQTITCTGSCTWPSFPDCPAPKCDGIYNPGYAQNQNCGDCGTQSRACQSNGQWTGWSSCAGKGLPPRSCGNCGTQSCQSNGYWSSCAGDGRTETITSGCTKCQSRSRACQSNGYWSDWGECSGGGPCDPGQTDTSGCTSCKSRTCKSDCQWGPCSSSGSCTIGQTQCTASDRWQTCPICTWVNSGINADSDSKDKECGDSLCDNSNGIYDSTKTATETSCNDGLDNDCDGKTDCADSDCAGIGSCCSTPGQTQSQGCENCGTKTRTCQSNYQWSSWSACAGEGVCAIGQSETQSCGNCGSQSRTCSSSCQWGSYGACTGSGPCSPGDTSSEGCTSCKTKTCLNNCQWGPCSSSGSCTIGQTQCTASDRYQTCPSCTWVNSGTNKDSDAKDKECGDSLCDNSNGVYDSTRTASESAAQCKDGLDNDCDGKTDCVDPDCNGVAGCCTNINRECKILTLDQFKSLYKKCYKENNQEECNRIKDRIYNNNYYSCPYTSSDSSCCTNPSSCVYNSVCYPDGTEITLPNDEFKMKCIAHSPGQWVPDFEIDCQNAIDDDTDGLVDCQDTDCDGKINGTAKNQNNNPISLADIAAKQDTTTVKSAITNQAGDYSMPISCGTYDVAASHSDYAPKTQKNVLVLGRQDVKADFSLALGTSCEQDCTFASDNIIHASCDGKNGCSFYDSISKAACDLSQPGWLRDYNSSHYIVCAPGSPQPNVEIKASLTCSSRTLVKITRIVLYNGKPVKLVIAACG